MKQTILSLHYGRIAVLGPSWIWVRRTFRIAVPVSTFPMTTQQREFNVLSRWVEYSTVNSETTEERRTQDRGRKASSRPYRSSAR